MSIAPMEPQDDSSTTLAAEHAAQIEEIKHRRAIHRAGEALEVMQMHLRADVNPFDPLKIITPKQSQTLQALLAKTRKAHPEEPLQQLATFRDKALPLLSSVPQQDHHRAVARVDRELRLNDARQREPKLTEKIPSAFLHQRGALKPARTSLKGAKLALYNAWADFVSKGFGSLMISNAWPKADGTLREPNAVNAIVHNLSKGAFTGALFGYIHQHPDTFFSAIEEQSHIPIPADDPKRVALLSAIEGALQEKREQRSR